MRLLIKNGRVIDPASDIDAVMSVLTQDDKICAVEPQIDESKADAVIDAAGMIVAPGLVDMHVHLREPGFEYKEDIETGTLAAARGGFTSVACMANTMPVTDSPDKVVSLLSRCARRAAVNVFPIAALSEGQRGEKMTDIEGLIRAGAIAISDDGMPVTDANLMREAMRRSERCSATIISHCEDASIIKNGVINEGEISEKLGLAGRPAIAEEIMVSRDALLAAETGARVHIAHVSTRKSVDIIRSHIWRGIHISCETCPHYFTFTEEEVLKKGATAKVNPPLRTEDDKWGVIEGLADGTIDVIATDHAPHAAEEKERGLEAAPSGISGLETALAATLTALYQPGILQLSDIIEKMTVNPARILGIKKGTLAPGSDADIVIFDLDEKWMVDPEKFASKGKNTPFAGMELTGAVKYTIIGGKVFIVDSDI